MSLSEERLKEIERNNNERWAVNGLFFEDDGGAEDVRTLIAEVRRPRLEAKQLRYEAEWEKDCRENTFTGRG